jgi:hypothetical protein
VRDGVGVLGRVVVHDDVRAGERTEGERRDELTRALRHPDAHGAAGALQPAQDLHGLVGGDTARDAQRDAAARELGALGGLRPVRLCFGHKEPFRSVANVAPRVRGAQFVIRFGTPEPPKSV